MGWLFMQSFGGHACPKAYLDAQFIHQNDDTVYRVLKSTTKGSVYYAAVERVLRADPSRVVFAAVCLFKHRPRDR